MLYRIQDFFYRRKMLLIAYSIHRMNHVLHGIDIVPGAQVGSGLRIDHPAGIVIGAKVKIGSDCTIMQNVTLGTRHLRKNSYDDQFPTLGDNVIIGASSSVLGGIHVKSGSTVGANSVVLADVAENTTVYGVHK